MTRTLSVLCFLTALGPPVGARLSAAEFFVSPQGSDSQPGSRETPFATLLRAMRAVRELRAGAAEPGPVTVYLRGGRHELSEKLVFGPGDTGTEASPVTYTSYPGERAVLSGGRVIPGPWRKSAGKPYYETRVPDLPAGPWQFNSLYVNGRSRQRARFPNWDEKVLRAEGRAWGEDARQAFRFHPGDIDPEWTRITDADIVLLCSWTPTIHRIQEVVPERRVVRFHSSHGRNVDAWEKHFRYYVSNVFEALDRPGEWYLNRQTAVLYYYPMPGENMDAAQVVAPVLESRMIEFAGEPQAGRFIEHLRFRRLDFRHVDRDLDRYNGVYRQGHMFLDAAIHAVGLRSSVFEDCTIAQVGEYALELAAGCRNNRIQRCHIWDVGAGAMQIGVTDLATLKRPAHTRAPGDIILEAENSAISAPMVVARHPSASGGEYVVLPEHAAGGVAEFVVTPPRPDEYLLYAHVIAPSGTADSFYVQVNDGPKATYDTGNGRTWFSSPVVGRELDGSRLTASLHGGGNTIRFYGREAGTRLDRITLRLKREDKSGDGAGERAVLSNLIDNNCIHRLGTIWHGCYGIVNRFASLTRITHNEIYDTHWDAIGLDARWNWRGEKYSYGNVVAYNHLHHLGLRYHTDAAGVYQFGPLDTHIHHNYIHDTLAYPRICGFAGVYLDEQSRGALVENNLVHNVEWCAYFQHKGMDNVFRNNIGAFARDGLLRRGALNQTWKANFMEAYCNIYITDNDIALRYGWQAGDKPPILRRNMYHSTSPGTKLTFAGKPFAQWQAEGWDTGSVIGDPGCRNPAALDFSLSPDAAAIRAIGFVPFDSEIRKAGLYGEERWRRLPEAYPPRRPAPLWTAKDMSRLVAFSLDFEDMPDGSEPSVFRLVKEGEATFAVTSEAASTGGKSYRCVDRKGLKKPFYPYIHVAPRGLDSGNVTFAFDVMNSAKLPARFYVEFRGAKSTSDVGPSIRFDRDGTITANGTEVLRQPLGTWTRLHISFQLGAAEKQYALTVGNGPGALRKRLPFGHDTFAEIRWLGVSASEDADGVFYLDNMKFEID